MVDLGGWQRRLVEEGPRFLAERLVLLLLCLPAFLFGLVGRLRAWLYHLGILPVYRAPVPVISVGNLAVGGTGKTPVTDYLVKELLARGLRVAVVSRGYGGSGVDGHGLVSAGNGPLATAAAAGDEPFLLARRNPRALVLVNPRRREAIAAAVREHGAQVVVLDDGFQHLAVARDLDIVLLDAHHPLSNGRVLPAGRLREPAGALRRADLLLLTRSSDEPLPVLPVERPLLRCSHRLATVAVTLSGEERSLAELEGHRVFAFAGIAHPDGFFAALRSAGLTLSGTLPLPDHVRYDQALYERLSAAAGDAECLVTTEKDAVKLADANFDVRCYQVPLEIAFEEPGRLTDILDNCLQGKEVA